MASTSWREAGAEDEDSFWTQACSLLSLAKTQEGSGQEVCPQHPISPLPACFSYMPHWVGFWWEAQKTSDWLGLREQEVLAPCSLLSASFHLSDSGQLPPRLTALTAEHGPAQLQSVLPRVRSSLTDRDALYSPSPFGSVNTWTNKMWTGWDVGSDCD